MSKKSLNAYGIAFRYKGSKDQVHGIFFAKNEEDLGGVLNSYFGDWSEVDKRTVSWGEVASSPLSRNGEPFFIHGNVEEIG